MELVGDNTVDGNIYRSTSTGIAAAGTTQGTATALLLDVNNVTTVSSGTGVVLPAFTAGVKISVFNNGANALLVYPASGYNIDALGTNVAISIPVGSEWSGITVSSTNWQTSASIVIGTANQTTVSYNSANSTIAIANNPIIPGTASATLPMGTTAQRPGSPTDAMIRYNSDEDILEGYSEPYTLSSQINPVAFQRTILYRKRRWWEDEFVVGSAAGTGTALFGELNWSVSGAGTVSTTITTGVTDHPGILTIGTGGTSGNNSIIRLGNGLATDILVANQIEYFCFLIRIPTITNIVTRVGLFNNMTTTGSGTTYTGTSPTNTGSVYFTFDSSVNAALQFFTSFAGTTSTAVNTVTVAAATWYLIEAFYNGTTWTPVVNGTTYTAQSSNIPTSAVNVGLMVNTLSANTRSVDFDFFSMYTTELGNRY
jgi:hypothetical protein